MVVSKIKRTSSHKKLNIDRSLFLLQNEHYRQTVFTVAFDGIKVSRYNTHISHLNDYKRNLEKEKKPVR